MHAILLKDGVSFCYYTHVLCISSLVRDIHVSKGICLLIKRYFCAVYDLVEKTDLSKSYQQGLYRVFNFLKKS